MGWHRLVIDFNVIKLEYGGAYMNVEIRWSEVKKLYFKINVLPSRLDDCAMDRVY